MTYEVFSMGDLVLSYRMIAFKLAATRATLASLDSSLTPAQQSQHRLHAADFSGRARQIATFLDVHNTAFKARMEAHKRPVRQPARAMPYPQPHPTNPPSAPPQPKPDGKPHPVQHPSSTPHQPPRHPQPVRRAL
jgi:hypothetical protein